MKKIFAILVTICMFISMFSISSFAALLTELDAAPVGTLLRVTATKGEETVLSYEIISKKYIGEMDTEPGFVSDHYGVITVFERKGVQ